METAADQLRLRSSRMLYIAEFSMVVLGVLQEVGGKKGGVNRVLEQLHSP